MVVYVAVHWTDASGTSVPENAPQSSAEIPFRSLVMFTLSMRTLPVFSTLIVKVTSVPTEVMADSSAVSVIVTAGSSIAGVITSADVTSSGPGADADDADTRSGTEPVGRDPPWAAADADARFV